MGKPSITVKIECLNPLAISFTWSDRPNYKRVLREKESEEYAHLFEDNFNVGSSKTFEAKEPIIKSYVSLAV